MIRLKLSDEERRSLETIRNRHRTPYIRERAGAILQIADGWSVRRVALYWLPRKRRPETVGSWVHGYLESRSIPVHKPRRRPFSPSRG